MPETEPYKLDLPMVQGNIAQTYANLIALRNEVYMGRNVRPDYSIHGHRMDWMQLWKFLGEEADRLQRELSRTEIFEFVSIGR
jgi:hypothetical protein